MAKKKLIIIVGPTAVGKTDLSIALASTYNCPILSFDSRQFYAEMSIGTAKPTAAELARAEHYFIGSNTIHERYTAGMFERDALKQLEAIYLENDYCIAVGGSGLYIDALAYGIDDIPADEGIRQKLKQLWQTEGLEVLQQKVLAVDPDFYHAADMKNARRVIRALEVYELTGKTYSSFRKSEAKDRSFDTIWIGLNLERPILFERINQRVHLMLEAGLLEEVQNLIPHKDLKALKTVGYSELFDYFDSIISLEKAVELIQRNSRHYAKRQVTWFKKNKEVFWFEPNQLQAIKEKINVNFCE